MKTYKVTLEYWQTIELTIEADNEEEAEETALEEAADELESPNVTITLISDDEQEEVDHSNDPMPGQLNIMDLMEVIS